MKQAINFVRGAIAKNEAIPILTHIHVYDGRIQASNGRICIDTPCEELKGLTFTLPVKDFVRAIDVCETEPNLTVKENILTVKSGKFKATFSMLPEEYPLIERAPEAQDINIKILPVLKRLQPFISTNANRPWSCGIFFDHTNAYATNNVVMLTTPCDDMGVINLSEACVEELLRIGKEPEQLISTENQITFIYDNGAWLRSNTLSTAWPDVSRFIPDKVKGFTVTATLREDVEKVALFASDSNIQLGPDKICTLNGATEIDGYNLPQSYFNAQHIKNVLKIANEIDFSSYPSPCPFMGDDVRGVIIGVKP